MSNNRTMTLSGVSEFSIGFKMASKARLLQ